MTVKETIDFLPNGRGIKTVANNVLASTLFGRDLTPEQVSVQLTGLNETVNSQEGTALNPQFSVRIDGNIIRDIKGTTDPFGNVTKFVTVFVNGEFTGRTIGLYEPDSDEAVFLILSSNVQLGDPVFLAFELEEGATLEVDTETLNAPITAFPELIKEQIERLPGGMFREKEILMSFVDPSVRINLEEAIERLPGKLSKFKIAIESLFEVEIEELGSGGDRPENRDGEGDVQTAVGLG
jgi:hypothetical protein